MWTGRVAGNGGPKKFSWTDEKLAAEAHQAMREQAVGDAFYQVLLYQATAPGRRNCAGAIVRAGELPDDSGDDVRVTTDIGCTQNGIPKIVRGAECPEGGVQRRSGRVVRL